MDILRIIIILLAFLDDVHVTFHIKKMAEMTHTHFNNHNYQKEASRLIIKVSENSFVILDIRFIKNVISIDRSVVAFEIVFLEIIICTTGLVFA